MSPYYERHGVTLYNGDARDVLPRLRMDPARTVVITDPPWPNMPEKLRAAYSLDVPPEALWARVVTMVPDMARRLVVEMGCNSDPRFLSAIPASLPFVRVCWLRYALPGFQGTVLNSGNVAYVYGDNAPGEGLRLLPGEITASRVTNETRKRIQRYGHPTPRRMEHANWLIRHFTQPGDTVIDPFAGSCTILLAAREQGRRAIGVEVNEAFCSGALRRFEQEPMFPPEAA